MQSAGRKIVIQDSMHANKFEEQFPTIRISAKSVSELKVRNFNEFLLADCEFRVVGIEDREQISGDKEPFYTLELRKIGMREKPAEEMTSEEILKKVEEDQ